MQAGVTFSPYGNDENSAVPDAIDDTAREAIQPGTAQILMDKVVSCGLGGDAPQAGLEFVMEYLSHARSQGLVFPFGFFELFSSKRKKANLRRQHGRRALRAL